MSGRLLVIVTGVLFVLAARHTSAQSVQASIQEKEGMKVFTLSNAEVTQQVFIRDGMLAGDVLSGNKAWLSQYHRARHGVATDGDFALNMMWTAWSAPGKTANADVQVSFHKRDFRYRSYAMGDAAGGGKELALYFYPSDRANTIGLRITYQLLPGKFYVRRQVAVRDTLKETNWLDSFMAREGRVSAADGNGGRAVSRVRRLDSKNYTALKTRQVSYSEDNRIVKRGAFGQPCAVDFASGGVFFGVEYPAATTTIQRADERTFDLKCKEIIGTVVKDQWVASKWVVEGLSPDQHIKNWFFKYLPDIRIAPDRPYALYNSWYDLRSPAFKHVEPEHIMNEKNILHIIDLFKKNMIAPYGIHLDAFVLDDGWDVHRSDWQLKKSTFPHGLKPISEALKPLGTTLGIWFGPTGGYSFRTDRISWMKDHGYEVTGHGSSAMMCIGGKKYSALFRKRTTDMVKNGGVGYFKWDGIQFSCSDPSHGHPVGYYSRRALLDSVIAKCKAVRAINPDVFLNITSGTWLSPWWMKYANQIWMQGGDYGFAGIPSVSRRDASMTYKDIVLYHDFHDQDNWFPVANLMTHGIIKGKLNEIGGADDPLNKFTDDAMFYFGRGVTMYELYISPDLLDQGEWNALSKSLKWAENRFPELEHTAMIGGDPGQGEAYGYVHFKNNKGIIAVRNPGMQPQHIQVKLDPADGLDPEARSLVLERVYPTRRISPDLYAAGATVDIALSGYESAVYEIYPLDSVRRPLLADVTFSVKANTGRQYDVDVLQAGKRAGILNPGIVSVIRVNGRAVPADDLTLPAGKEMPVLRSKQLSFNGAELKGEVTLDQSDRQPRLVVFLKPDSADAGKTLPGGELLVDGKAVKATVQHQKGAWAVYSFVLPDNKPGGAHAFRFELKARKATDAWKGIADVWVITQQQQPVQTVSITAKNDVKVLPMPPAPYEADAVRKEVHLGSGVLGL